MKVSLSNSFDQLKYCCDCLLQDPLNSDLFYVGSYELINGEDGSKQRKGLLTRFCNNEQM